jgi:AAHS family 4-hydroxybenzoate transporter-like MFS transporter
VTEAKDAGKNVDVVAVMDSAPVSRFVLSIVIWCGAVALLDGFDTLAISYVAPVIAEAWKLPKEAFGPVFAAHYIGAAIGAAGFGVLADRIGRRPAIIWSTATFGVFALLTVLTRDFSSLLIARAMTGLGLGGALSNAIGLVAESSPARARATLVSAMYAAFPLGGVLGGPLSALLIHKFGWQAVFLVGGVTPLVLLVALAALLPESVRYLVTRKASPQHIASLLTRIAANATYSARDTFVLTEAAPAARQTIKQIFSREYLVLTPLLSLASFITQMVIVFVITWMPTLLKSAGLPLTRAITASATFSLGGIVGSLLLARIIDEQRSYHSLVLTYVASAVVIGLIGVSALSWAWLLAIVCLAGITIVGAQVNLSAYSATVYPTEIRSTGLGWIIGIGRIGAVAGALLGTGFVAAGLALETQYLVAAAPALLAAAAVAFTRARPHISAVAA